MHHHQVAQILDRHKVQRIASDRWLLAAIYNHCYTHCNLQAVEDQQQLENLTSTACSPLRQLLLAVCCTNCDHKKKALLAPSQAAPQQSALKVSEHLSVTKDTAGCSCTAKTAVTHTAGQPCSYVQLFHMRSPAVLQNSLSAQYSCTSKSDGSNSGEL